MKSETDNESPLKFELEAVDGQARAATIQTHHGEIETPIFMPVGTRGSVKSLWQEDLEELDAHIILGNTYHLYLRPGSELVSEMGGLHKFIGWNRPILTDSGGFQVYSLSGLNKITDDGVHFSSHIDGSKHFMGPRESMKVQRDLGSDIVMCFDECPALPASHEKLVQAVERTTSWARLCRDYQLQEHQSLFGIVQGGLDLELRRRSLSELREMNFEGYALGGLSVGEKNEEMQKLLESFTPEMPKDQPRYLMGVGKPMDILWGIKCGIDMFDCVLPSRNARNGQALTSRGPLNLKNQKYKKDETPLDPDCACRVCQRYSRSYIRHLMNVGEYLGGQLLTFHNIAFYLNLVKKARHAIKNQVFDEFFAKTYKEYSSSEK